MRHFLLSTLVLVLFSLGLNAQERTKSNSYLQLQPVEKSTKAITKIYSQDFEGDFPGNMTIIDVDKKTPNAKVAKYGKEWSKQVISGMNVGAVTSWFNPAGKADDWMITPAIDVTTDNQLIWTAASLDGQYRETYEVLISTTEPDPASFDASKFTLLEKITKEEPFLKTRIIDLKEKGYENTKVWIAFHFISNDCYVLVVDNIMVAQFDGIEVENSSVFFDEAIKLNGTVTVSPTIRNNLLEKVTSVEMEWYVEGSTDKHTQVFDGLSLGYKEMKQLSFTDKYTGTANGEEKIIVELTKVNGSADLDEDKTNNTKSFKVETIETPVARKVLIEEATGTWCQYCPDGAVVLKKILESNDNVIGVAVHNGDAMQIDETKELCNALAGGYPSAMINRTQFGGKTGVSRGDWKKNAEEMIANMPTSVSIKMEKSYNENTKELTADLKVNFTNEKKGDFRVNLYIVEDKLKGTGQGWDQANYFDKVDGHPMFGLGNPIKGYEHNHVVRKMLGGAWGTNGVIPATAKGEYSHQYKFTLPADWKAENTHIVATVGEYGESKFGRKIFNVAEAKLVEAQQETHSVEIYSGGNKVDISQPISVAGKSTDDELVYKFKAKNTSSANIKVKLMRELVEAPKNQSFYFCWKDCYDPAVTESSIMTIEAGKEHAEEISLHLEPNDVDGTAKYKVILQNTENDEDKTEFTVHFVVSKTTGIEDINIAEFKAYPNPVSDNLSIKIQLKEKQANYPVIEIYNMNGKLVKTQLIKELSGEQLETVNCENLASGVYSYAIKFDNSIQKGKFVKL